MKFNLPFSNVRAASAWKNSNNLRLGLMAMVSLLVLPSGPVHGQTQTWTGNSGSNWSDAGNWTSAVPGAGTEARFTKDASVTISGAAVSGTLVVRPGVVSLALEDGASLGSASVNIGTTGGVGIFSVGTDADASGTFTLNRIYIGYSAGGDGSSATFSGSGLTVNATASRSIVGSSSSGNSLEVQSGATVALHSLRLGSDNYHGNTLTVTGAGSSVSVLSDTLDIAGANSGGTNAYDNKLFIQNGGAVSLAQGLNIGRASGAYSNQLTIGGNNAKLTMTAGAAIQVGQNASPSNLGNNLIRVDAGGILETDGNVGIYGYNSSEEASYGRNALMVADGGSVTQTGSRQITIGNDAVLQLAAGGAIQSPKIQIASGGLLEAAGTGLNAEVTEIGASAILRIGGEIAASASVLTLNKELSMLDQSSVEMRVFNTGSADQILLGASADWNFTGNVTFRLAFGDYTPVANDSWSFFTGNTAGINGTFATMELPDLTSYSLQWDTSGFNESGNWTLSVVPEPRVTLLFLTGAALLALRRMK